MTALMTVGETRVNAEQRRLEESYRGIPWKKWGPYLSERQWGTVREDLSDNGDAWNHFPHDHARSRAYRRGEDGLAGFSDDKSRLCFALGLWNGQDPILKERLFGLSSHEGNHGEDVKEYYFYLDSTPTHSYMKWLYKYPQKAYPYDQIVEISRDRSKSEMEYELLDTGIFDEDRYFDVFVEYAKANPEEILIRITVFNRGPEAAALRLLPTLWFRDTWTGEEKPVMPVLRAKTEQGIYAIVATHPELGERWLHIEKETTLLFTENATNTQRLLYQPNATPYVKDAFDQYVVKGNKKAVNPRMMGTKAAADFRLRVIAGASEAVNLILSNRSPVHDSFVSFDSTLKQRQAEADQFYRAITPARASEDEARILRQSLAGMLWSKQHFIYDVDRWLKEHHCDPLSMSPSTVRNREWGHMLHDDIISMPDKWEFPWFAAWDLAFHALPLSLVDIDFAKEQLDLLLRETYQHPNGQIPAYEWNFSDVNPPVHAWATLCVYRTEQAKRGKGDLAFLKRSFGKLLANFTWWLNRKDRFGKNIFEGGFLGLDNIGVFDRSSSLPTGGYLEQADATGWMAFFSHNMLEMAIEIAAYDASYDALAAKFVDHALWIGHAINRIGPDGLWDEEDGFFYDVLRTPDGNATRLRVRSAVGLLPLCATTVMEPWQRDHAPMALRSYEERVRRHPELIQNLYNGRGYKDRGLLAMVGPDRMRRILARMLDESEFLGPHGIRALSRYHLDHPYIFNVNGEEYRVRYAPGDSDSDVFGGNSNWRGPVWMPINLLLIRALVNFYCFYGNDLKVECPTGSGCQMTLYEVAREISNRLVSAFLQDSKGRRPIYGEIDKFQNDPHWRDNIIFPEYFHGDTGAAVGASHQTGWTGAVANLIDTFGNLSAEEILVGGKKSYFTAQAKSTKKPKLPEPFTTESTYAY